MGKKIQYELKVQNKGSNTREYISSRKGSSGTLIEKKSFQTEMTAGDGVTKLVLHEAQSGALPTGQAVKVTIECVQTTLDEVEETQEEVAQ